jgi:hypothetical protein
VAEQKIGTCGEEAQHCAGTPLASTVKASDRSPLSLSSLQRSRTAAPTAPRGFEKPNAK